MIETSHYFADFLEIAYGQCRDEILDEKQLKADESPLRMLEGSEKMGWQLWAFIATFTAYYEAHDTRAGVVCTDLLKKSNCIGLLTDVHSGYEKSVKDINEYRKEKKLPLIENYNCNAHALRRFKEPYIKDPVPQYEFYYFLYKEIYEIERQAKKTGNENELLKLRATMRPLYEKMKAKAEKDIRRYSSKGPLVGALTYFLNNYENLTKFITNPHVDIDNNASERRVKNHALGRKNWYGNHSIRGVKTYVILYTLIETCRLNAIDPFKYFSDLVSSLHQFGHGNWRRKKDTPPDDPDWMMVNEKRKIFSFTPRQYRERLFPVVSPS
jgi:hypothetical protein